MIARNQFKSYPAPVPGGTFVPFNMCVNIYLVYFKRLAIYAFLLSRAVARGYSLLSPFKLM